MLYKVKHKTFIQCFEHAECIAIDVFDMLGIGVTECTVMGSLEDVKKKETQNYLLKLLWLIS